MTTNNTDILATFSSDATYSIRLHDGTLLREQRVVTVRTDDNGRPFALITSRNRRNMIINWDHIAYLEVT